jgi:glycosyltransferase involved in cell wall biosynthesis
MLEPAQIQLRHAGQWGGGDTPLKVAMIGLRGVPATWGGVERAVEELSAKLADLGHHVTVYGRIGYGDSSHREHRGVDVRWLPAVQSKHFEAASHTALAMFRAIRSREFDLIHIHSPGPGLLSVVPRLAGIPCVVTIHAADWRSEKWGRFASAVLKLGARVAARTADRTIVVSRGLQDLFASEYGIAPEYIPNGVAAEELELQQPVDGLEPRNFVLFLGRLVPEKQVHMLVDAFKQLDTEQKLAIVGPPTHSRAYVAQIEALADGDDRIMFMGPRYGAEKAWLLRNASAFAQPSAKEGLPITLLEAIACGAMPVYSDIPEHREVMDTMAFGIPFRAGDRDDLVSKLRMALEQDADGNVPSEASRLAVVKAYDWTAIASQTVELYRAVIAARQGPRRR